MTALPPGCTAGRVNNLSSTSSRSDIQCTQCLEGLVLNSNECTDTCPSGTFATTTGATTACQREFISCLLAAVKSSQLIVFLLLLQHVPQLAQHAKVQQASALLAQVVNSRSTELALSRPLALLAPFKQTLLHHAHLVTRIARLAPSHQVNVPPALHRDLS